MTQPVSAPSTTPADEIRWGLERTERILAAVGDPHTSFPVLHVGGTNGKGSVAAMLASILTEDGLRTGLYTSPHLRDFAERVQVDGSPLEAGARDRAAGRVRPLARREGASPFEAATSAAFLALAEADVDFAVIEVGLGGRLDATNVVVPEAVALTNVALDHVDYLGDDLESVAREKAGIIKSGVPVATAAADPAVLALFGRCARAVGASLHRVGLAELRDVRVDSDGTRFRLHSEVWGELALETPLIGRHQALNAALAVHTLELLPAEARPSRGAVTRGLRRVRWPGRLQVERSGGRTWVLDAAHNPAAVRALVDTLPALELPRPHIVLAGILADKDWRSMLGRLSIGADAVVLTVPPSAPPARRWDPRAALPATTAPVSEAVPAFDEALERAATLAGSGTILVTGSQITVGAALAALDVPTRSEAERTPDARLQDRRPRT